MQQLPNLQKPWYRYWWGKSLIGIGMLFGAIAVFFLMTFVDYWWQIKHGVAVKLPQSKDFTAIKAVGNTVAEDRGKLEGGNEPFLGRKDAPHTIVEFTDYKCPFCKEAAPILEQVANTYGSKVKIVVRDFPADESDPELHPGATYLSELARCVYTQNRFSFPLVYDQLYRRQDLLVDPLPDVDLQNLATLASVDEMKLRTCLADPQTAKEVSDDYILGVGAGVRGTPTFFVDGTKVEGVVAFETWQKYLDSLK